MKKGQHQQQQTVQTRVYAVMLLLMKFAQVCRSSRSLYLLKILKS